VSLPENIPSPWNNALSVDGEGTQRPTIVMLDAVHGQMCVVADLLRVMIADEVGDGVGDIESTFAGVPPGDTIRDLMRERDHLQDVVENTLGSSW